MRLIDADVLIKKLLKIDDDIVRACIGVIMTERTAYDVEKVVAELEEKSAMDIFDKDWYVRKNEAIRVVRKGGVE